MSKKDKMADRMSVYKMRARESCQPCSPLKNHWKNTIKIENSNTENINWMLTVVNKCLTALNPSAKMSALTYKSV